MIKAIRSIDRCHVAVIMFDADRGIAEQDARICGYALDRSRGIVLAVNKWDLVKKDNDLRKKLDLSIERQLNFISYKNTAVDRLLETGRRSFDLAARKKAYFKIQEILAEEVPYVFLYVPYALPIIHNRFQNIKPTPIGISYNIHKWFVPKKLQRHTLTP